MSVASSRAPVLRRFAIVALVLVAGVAHGQSEDVETWLRRCEARVKSVRRLEARLAALFDEQRGLQDDITALKAGRDGGGVELQALLESSLNLEAELEAGLDARDELRQRTARDCDQGMERVRAELRRLQPFLRKGPMSERRAVARQIQGLRAQLADLEALRRILSPPEGQVGLAWSDLPLEIDPLDGPEDLSDKADFVEDARDRLKEKRALLARLYDESRQARALRRAARDFVTDIQIFDEAARSPQSAQPTSNGQSEQRSGGEAEPGAGDDASGGGGITDAPGPVEQGGDELSPPTSDEGGGGPLLGLDGEGAREIPPSPLVEPGNLPPLEAPGSSSGLTSGASPSFLLNLRVDQLEDRKLDLRTLEKLLQDMVRLDEVLAARAVEMRMKARELGRDESP